MFGKYMSIFRRKRRGVAQVSVLGQYAVICKAVSTNIHDKREKNPSKKPEVAKPPRVFYEDFSRVWSEYLRFC